jgi:hypothetical protein
LFKTDLSGAAFCIQPSIVIILQSEDLTMTQETSELQISASQADNSMTVQMMTRYGPLCVSYSPKGIELGISNLVNAMLLGATDSVLPVDLDISESARQLLRKSAETYREHEGKQFPVDAIERFSQTARGYSQGTLEQFIDNLPAALSLMMDYVAIAALALGQTNEGTQANLTVEEKRQTLSRILRDQFAEAQ